MSAKQILIKTVGLMCDSCVLYIKFEGVTMIMLRSYILFAIVFVLFSVLYKQDTDHHAVHFFTGPAMLRTDRVKFLRQVIPCTVRRM